MAEATSYSRERRSWEFCQRFNCQPVGQELPDFSPSVTKSLEEIRGWLATPCDEIHVVCRPQDEAAIRQALTPEQNRRLLLN